MLVWHQPGFGWYPGWVRGGRGVTLHLKPKCNYSLSGKPQGARLDQSADCFAACGRYQQQPVTGYFLLLKHPPPEGKGARRVRLGGGTVVFSMNKRGAGNLFSSCFTAGCLPCLCGETSGWDVPLVSVRLHGAGLVCKSLSPAWGQMQTLARLFR